MNKVSKKMVIENVRGSYVYIDQPKINVDKKTGVKKESYTMQLLIPKDSDLAKKIRKVQKKLIKEAFNSEKPNMFKLPLRDGDEERESPEYEGHYFMNANSGRRPGILNKAKEKADSDDIQELGYSGCYFHVSVNFYAFEGDSSKGIAVGLNNVMLSKAGDRLDGATNASEDFEGVAADDDDDLDDFDDDDDLD